MKLITAGLLIVTVMAGTVLAGPPAISQVVTPGTISYQGQMQKVDGSAYADGIYGIEFRLYDAATDGTMLWGAKYEPYLKGGFFSVILGQTDVGETALSGGTYTAVSDFWKAVWIDPNSANKDRFLGITIVSELGVDMVSPHESFPRQQLQASPFAIQAQFAQQAEYANQSTGDFTVGGQLVASSGTTEISGNVHVDGSLQVNYVESKWLQLKTTDSNNEILADSNGVTVSSDESITLQSTSDVDITPSGDANLTVGGNMTLSATAGALELQGSDIRFDRNADNAYTYPLHAPANGLRMAYAHISADGLITSQSGGFYFKGTHAAGTYDIGFTAFSQTPMVIVTPAALEADGFPNTESTVGWATRNNFVTATYISESRVIVYGYDVGGHEEATPFDIILIGEDN